MGGNSLPLSLSPSLLKSVWKSLSISLVCSRHTHTHLFSWFTVKCWVIKSSFAFSLNYFLNQKVSNPSGIAINGSFINDGTGIYIGFRTNNFITFLRVDFPKLFLPCKNSPSYSFQQKFCYSISPNLRFPNLCTICHLPKKLPIDLVPEKSLPQMLVKWILGGKSSNLL